MKHKLKLTVDTETGKVDFSLKGNSKVLGVTLLKTMFKQKEIADLFLQVSSMYRDIKNAKLDASKFKEIHDCSSCRHNPAECDIKDLMDSIKEEFIAQNN